jgi:hypothetical protein
MVKVGVRQRRAPIVLGDARRDDAVGCVEVVLEC